MEKDMESTVQDLSAKRFDWGGLPAWYLPNYWGVGTLKVAGPTLVNSLHAAMDAADHIRAIDQIVPVKVQYAHGPTIQGDQLRSEMEQVRNAISMVLSFIKEMSPSDIENHSYPLEREWRIVSGMNLTGQPSAYRQLTDAEKEKLCTTRPAWRKQRESSDVNISSRYGAAAIVDSFQFFNGLSDRATVAQCIATILVPDQSEAQWAQTFIINHANRFSKSAPPRVVIFPRPRHTSVV